MLGFSWHGGDLLPQCEGKPFEATLRSGATVTGLLAQAG